MIRAMARVVEAPAGELRRWAWLFPLVILLSCWCWTMVSAVAASDGPNGRDFAKDFAHSYTAAVIIDSGGNPYDSHLLWRTEQSILRPLDLPVERETPAVQVGTPPAVLWLMAPFTELPFQVAAVLWMLLLLGLSAAGFLGILRYLGWNSRLLPCLMLLATPQVALTAYYGNMTGMVIAAIGCALPLLTRRPWLAGAVLSLAMIKPQIGLPIALLIVLFHSRRRGQVLAGLAVALLLRELLSVVVLGGHFELWEAQSLLGFADRISLQPNLISLTGLYDHLVPYVPRAEMELASVGVALALTAVWWRRLRAKTPLPILTTAWLWFLWLIATPYAHFIDEALLAVPVLAVMGPDGRDAARPAAAFIVYGVVCSVLLYSWTPANAQFLWLPLFAAGAYLRQMSRRLEPLPLRLPRADTAPA